MLASVLYLVALSKAEVSYVYPLIALGYVVTALLAKFYFPLIGVQSENIGLIRWFGILLILGGVFLVTRS
jgi:drug/metabolite transporter (DMT)-like permease